METTNSSSEITEITYREENNKIETPKKSWFWIKNSDGRASATLTFLSIAFVVTTLVFVLGHIGQISFGEFSISFNQFDATAASVYYLPLMMLYFKRREFESNPVTGRPSLVEMVLNKNSNKDSNSNS